MVVVALSTGVGMVQGNLLEVTFKVSNLLTAPLFGLFFMAMFVPIFTGMVMMAAKQLSFTVPNVAMILLSVVLIVFEIRRSKPLKYASIAEEGAFEKYKKDARTILASEIVLIILISIWMFI